MNCPDCGYIMTAFDKECPRCQKYQRLERSCPHCGTVNITSATTCKKCGHPFQSQGQPPRPAQMPMVAPRPLATEPVTPLRVAPEPAPAEASLQSQSPSPLTTPLTADMLACRMCGNTNGQKLTAICRAGSWTVESRGYSVGMGSDGYGDTVMVGGPTSSTSHGQTALAGLLLPPNRPFFQPSRIGSILVPIVGFLASLAAYSAGPLAASVGVLLTSGLWFFVILTEGRAAATGLARYTLAHSRWEQAMQIWGRLFYCSRCDHVYDPQEGTAAAPHAMNTLLYAKTDGRRAIHEMPDDSAAVKAACLAFGVAVLLLVGIWSVSANAQRTEQEQAQHTAQVHTALLGQYQAALPSVDAAIAAGDRAAAANAGSDAGSDYTRSAKVSELATDLSELKSHRDSARQELDDLGKATDASSLQEEATQFNAELDAMLTSRESVSKELRELGKPVVLASPHPAAPGLYSTPIPAEPVNPPDPVYTAAPPDVPSAPSAGTAEGTDPPPSYGADSSSGTQAVPGNSYSITTKAGGGQPPDPASLPH